MTSLTLVRLLDAGVTRVYEALTRPEHIAQWWGPDAGPVLVCEADVRVSGRFRVRFRTLEGSEHEARGEYLEVIPEQRLVLSWRWVDEPDPESRVILELRPRGTGTEVTLTHERLASEAARDSHRQGWEGSLDKLVRLFTRR
jgi:uncharacterized protein YndB with AHSA1/START domain